jgi:hypothetical protein
MTRVLHRLRLGLMGGAAITCPACLDLPPIEYETEQALIGADFDLELCPEDFARIDRHIAFVEDMLDAQSDEKIEIYLYAGQPPRCYGGLSCYDKRRKVVRTHWTDLPHEIVHAVVDRFAEPSTFWNEGIASALDANGTFAGLAAVTQSVHVRNPLDLDYNTAGHFVRWLLEEHDPTLIRPLLEGAAFESLYERPFAEAAATYERERPAAYPPWFPCDYTALPPDEGDWRETVEVGCDTPGGTRTNGSRYAVLRTVELTPGRYELQTLGGVGTRLLGCQLDPFEQWPPANFHGDVPSEVESSQTHPGVLFESGPVHEFEITEPGVFKVVMMAREEDETVEVELRPLE